MLVEFQSLAGFSREMSVGKIYLDLISKLCHFVSLLVLLSVVYRI